MYTVYHIPGVKVGGSERVEARVKEQGFTYYEVLEVCNTEKELSEREIYWQDKLEYKRDRRPYSYTRSIGKLANTPEAKAKRSATQKISEVYKESRKAAHTPEAKAKRSATQKISEVWKNAHKFVYFHTPEARAKCKKPVLQYDLNNNFIKEWTSAKDAAEELKLNSSSITGNCKGRLKTACKFIWKYKN